jgi:hypothetical protein
VVVSMQVGIKKRKENLTIDIELGALVKKTEALGTVLASEEVLEGTRERTSLDLDLVAGNGGVVAARDLVVVTAGGLGLLDRDVAGRPERLLSLGDFTTLGAGANVGQSNCRGGESKDNRSILHFDGFWVF